MQAKGNGVNQSGGRTGPILEYGPRLWRQIT
jgi:hypothetical protein